MATLTPGNAATTAVDMRLFFHWADGVINDGEDGFNFVEFTEIGTKIIMMPDDNDQLVVEYSGGSGMSIYGAQPYTGSFTTIVVKLGSATVGTLTGISRADNFPEVITANAWRALDGNDILGGSNLGDWLTGGFGGNDVYTGNGGNDTFEASTRSVAPTHTFVGSADSTDTIFVRGNLFDADAKTLDLRSSGLASIEAFVVAAGLTVQVGSAQFSAGGISLSELTGGGTFEIFLAAASFSLAGFTPDGTTVRINGTLLKETIRGSEGRDFLFGLQHKDTLDGRAGNDEITGGLDRDVLRGGKGQDDFNFTTLKDTGRTTAKRDVILDFTHLQDDIDLSAIDANGAAPGDKAFRFLAKAGAAFTGVKGQLHWYLENKPGTANDRTVIEGDINGDKQADFHIALTGLKTLTIDDIVI
ncbi:MAG TPA: M10 family metallopeptidase C-terminal domain-containing protein [Bauldia sp.]|nr:M10 family metallopeptidase C-terminal domain-containing protein [Bauldia sp.]